MTPAYDVIVAGLGGMGSAVAARCAQRGRRVLGLEQFARGHALGASTGKTRIIRQAYFEDPAYVPLLLRAYELWRDLERRTGDELMRITGLLMCGLPDSEVIAGSTRAARAYDLPVDVLSADDVRARYPQLRVLPDEVGIFEREGGAVFPERAVHAHLALAERSGAELRFNTAMRAWRSKGDRVEVELAGGSRVSGSSLVIALGPWIGSELAAAGVPLELQRNVQVWFAPRTPAYESDAFPAFLVDRASLPAPMYGFPDFGGGVKAAFHGSGGLTQPDVLEREIDPATDVEPLVAALESWMPGAAGSYLEGKACLYALTPDRHFVVDHHPAYDNVVLCGGFSGHGFKFASVIGEIGADLALARGTQHDIAFLSLRRFAPDDAPTGVLPDPARRGVH